MPDSGSQRVASVAIRWSQIISPSNIVHCSFLNLCNYTYYVPTAVYFHLDKQYMSSWFCYFDFLRQDFMLPMLTLNSLSLKLWTSSSSCFHFPSARIVVMHHHSWPDTWLFNLILCLRQHFFSADSFRSGRCTLCALAFVFHLMWHKAAQI